jgi:hypothetical protein
MKHINTFFLLVLIASSLRISAQARLEVIHNSADAAASSVDIYVNGSLLLDDFAFRTTSGFIDVPAGAILNVAVAPAMSANVSEAIATFPLGPLANGGKYIAIASGIVSPSGYSPATPFNIDVISDAREIATSGMMNTDVLVYHGATDAPAVDVAEVNAPAGQIVSNLSYSQSQGYLELVAADYVLQIQDGTSNIPVAAFDAPLGTLGLNGAAVTVIASGFINPTMNSNGEPFGLFASVGVAGPLVALPSSMSRLEVIHNAADASVSEVDVYLNGEMFIDNFAFRTTTGFIDAPAAMPLEIAVAGANSMSAAEAIATFPLTLGSGKTYVVVANGIVSPSGYTPVPAFNLDIFDQGREAASMLENTDVLVYHGSTDAPEVDVEEVGVGAGIIINDLAYNSFSAYLELGTADYVLQVQEGSANIPVVAYDAPLSALGLTGKSITVVASGFLDPSMNSNGAAFGLFASTGVAGALLPLPASTSRLEVIHNSSDAAAEEVDVYLNGEMLIDNFAFRTTTGFIDAPAAMPLEIAVAGSNSISVADALATFPVTLESGKTYVVVANGIVSPSGYSPAPAFNLDIFDQGREEANMMGNTDVLVYHGASDAPTVDVSETGVGAGTIVDDIAYNGFQGYLELGTADYELTVQDMSGLTDVASFGAPLATLGLENAAITVLASGFLNPMMNSNGPSFGLWVSLGTAGGLIPLPAVTTGIDEQTSVENLNLYPNPSNDVLTYAYEVVENTFAELTIMNSAGQKVYSKILGDLNPGVYRETIETSELPSGFYVANFVSSNGINSQKLQISK